MIKGYRDLSPDRRRTGTVPLRRVLYGLEERAAMQRQQRSELQRAKQPRTALAGPYGHPFHPMLVTLPIGAWVSSLVFDIIARSRTWS